MKNLVSSIFLITVLGLSASCFAPLHADEETPPQENFYKKLMLRDGDVITNIDDQPVSDPQQAFQRLESLRHQDIQISRDQEQSAGQNPGQLEESQSDEQSSSPAQE
jgi:PDZ domain-containing secreted protein